MINTESVPRARTVRRSRAGLSLLTACVVGFAMVPAASAAASAHGLAASAAWSAAAPVTASAAVPAVSGPVDGGNGLRLRVVEIPRPDGYAINEYFFSGTATGYTNTAPLTSDGQWSLAPASSAPYNSRLVVIAPTDPKRFSGTVHVEWLNVSFAEGAGVYNMVHDEMLRTGDAWVGVSAQSKGINEQVAADPARYSTLVAPGDTYSYDIFSQAGMAVREAANTILPGLEPETIIANGFSQSAVRLVTYVNGVAPLTHVFDAYMLHSRSGTGGPVSQAPQPAIPAPAALRVRTDQQVPVMTFETETDVAGPLQYLPARQPDSGFFRLWEVSGTAHFDATGLTGLVFSDDDSPMWHQQNFALMFSPPSSTSTGISCPAPFNTGQHKYVAQAAYHALEEWTLTGRAPAPRPRMDVDTGGSYIRDANGNVTGGIRTPAVDAPVSTLSGMPSSAACSLFGQTHPFSTRTLESLYPKKNSFEQAWTNAVNSARQLGNLLNEDAKALKDVVR